MANRTPCGRSGQSSFPHSKVVLLATLEFARCNESVETFGLIADLNDLKINASDLILGMGRTVKSMFSTYVIFF